MSLALALTLVSLAAAGPRSLGAEPPPRPVVFLPGVLGSKLCEGDKVVWGTVASYKNFERLILGLNPTDTTIDPCGVIERVVILGPLKSHQYDTLLDHLESLGYERGRTLFTLAYDWRQSNYESARRLARFVEDTPELRQRTFDIVGHSMGGVVARIYLDELGGDDKVENLVTLGTPHRGSLKIMRMLFEGFDGLGNWMAGGTEEVRRVAFTFPSIFELLPAYALCCIEVLPPGGSCRSGAAPQRCQHLQDRQPNERCCSFEILDQDYWLKHWIPPEYRDGDWKTRMLAGLASANKVRELLAKPVPAGVSFHPFAGDKMETLSQLYVDQGDGATRGWRYMGGDGTVLVTSAAAGDRSEADISFNKHAVIFRDKSVQAELGWKLLDEEVPVDFTEPSTDLYVVSEASLQPIPIDGIALAVAPAYAATGTPVEVRLDLLGLPTNPVRAVRVAGSITLNGGASTPLSLAEDPARSLGVDDPSAYYTGTLTPSAEGMYTVRVAIPGLSKEVEEYFVVLDPAVSGRGGGGS